MEENRELDEPKVLFILARDFGNGSGFFVEKDLIATNIHIVAGATSISAKILGTNITYAVEGVAAFDTKNDLVILKVAGEGTPLPIGDSDLSQNGDVLQAVGYPSGNYKVTEGPIHSIRCSDKWIRMKFKTDGGNSGGPVLNKNSEVIGIAVANADYFSFAIPVNAIKMLLTQTHEVEPLAQWQERKQIRAYACMVQSQINHFESLYGEAIVDLDKAIQLNPDNVRPWFRRGVAKSDLGQSKSEEGNVAEAQQYYQDAIDNYTEAIKLCADYAVAYNNRANTKRLLGISAVGLGNIETAQNLYQEAVVDVNVAIDLAPCVPLFYHTRGEIMYALNDYSGAVENYERACKIDPDYTDVCKDLELAKEALRQQKKSKN